MAEYCREVQDWIEEKIEQPVEEWIEKRVEKCKKKKCKKICLCCNKWLCWIETFLEKVITWVVITIGKWVTRVVCEIVHVILDVLGFVLGLIFSIPIIGRLLREIWDIIVEVANRAIGIFDLLGCALGINWTKRLRICVIILRDEKGTEILKEAEIQPAIEWAKKVYKEAANVDLLVNGVNTVEKPSPKANLNVSCGAGAWWDDLWVPGSYFEYMANTECFGGIANRVTGWAAPVTVFVVRSIDSGSGCSMSVFSDYVVIDKTRVGSLAHEVGHACGLAEDSSADNLMNQETNGPNLKKSQKCILRNSRHVSYL
jgi:hypothetical protein